MRWKTAVVPWNGRLVLEEAWVMQHRQREEGEEQTEGERHHQKNLAWSEVEDRRNKLEQAAPGVVDGRKELE